MNEIEKIEDPEAVSPEPSAEPEKASESATSEPEKTAPEPAKPAEKTPEAAKPTGKKPEAAQPPDQPPAKPKKKQKSGPKVKKYPERRCIGCQGTFLKKDLLRVVRSPEGAVSIDFTGKKSGRGAYLCKNETCLRKARKSGALHRALEVEISDVLYEELAREIKFELEHME